jgi:hypothetical protein
MSELRSVLDQIAGVDLECLTAFELDSEIEELVSGGQMIDVLIAKRVAVMEKRGDQAFLGHSSPTAHLMAKRLAPGKARRHVIRANSAQAAKATFTAWEDGRISSDQADHLFSLASTLPNEFPDAETRLIDIVEPLAVRATNRVLEYWRHSVEGPDSGSAENIQERRGVSLSETIDGLHRLDGWLTPIAGEALKTVLGALTPAPSADDLRTPKQRRHDALEDLARAYLDHGDTPTVGGEKPHLNLICDLEALQGIAGGTHETYNGTVIDVDTLRMLACDASICRIVLGPDSDILDVGRKTRVWTAAQRRAIIARDRHCVRPGCDRPPQWCDIHHKTHWANGGTTSVDQGELLCRFHHTLTHKEDPNTRGRPRP